MILVFVVIVAALVWLLSGLSLLRVLREIAEDQERD